MLRSTTVKVKVGSESWKELIAALYKPPSDLNFPIYVNHELTGRRNTMMYHLRQLKRVNPNLRFYSDHKGQISFRKDSESQKVCLTYVNGPDGLKSPMSAFGLDDIKTAVSKGKYGR